MHTAGIFCRCHIIKHVIIICNTPAQLAKQCASGPECMVLMKYNLKQSIT